MLTIAEAATRCGLKAATIRGKIRTGELPAIRINRQYRVDWNDIWRCEDGPLPHGHQMLRYQANLLSKKQVANALNVSVRTVERWIAEGLPTRSIFGAIRMNPHDVDDWFRATFDARLPADWWR